MERNATDTTQGKGRHDIPVRKPGFEFDTSIPRHWLNGNIPATHFFNGMNLVFPDGERFFVKAVHDHMDQIQDPELLAQVKGFAGQEGRHAHEHEAYFDTLRAQGYEIDGFLRRFRRFSQFTNRWIPASFRLAMTAGAEHWTATFGAGAIEDDILDNAHPTMRRLIIWHATEEIEHKAVAFDVLQATHPSYLLRIAGFVMATVLLFGWSLAGARMLVKQDHVGRATVVAQRKQMMERDNGRPLRRMKAGLRAYFRRNFHPSETDELERAHQRLAEVGIPVRV